MTAQEIRVEIERITAAVKRHEWTPEVFERTEAILRYQGGDIFNTLRRELLPEEYEWKLNSLSELQTLSKALADTSAALQVVSAAVERSASLGTFWLKSTR